jgi:hypothetical protein
MKAALTYARLLVDVCSTRLLVWLFGQHGELLDSHLFFFDRYSELADYHRRKGRFAKAETLAALAEAHFHMAPDDDEPPAAAMAMPLPRPPMSMSVVSTTRLKEPTLGPSSLAPSRS